jgi:Ca2+-binding EF-hand superfamily protein
MNKYLAMLAFGLSTLALAAEALPAFEQVDTNRDGVISKSEAATVEGLDFAKADANQDGMISREEYLALAKK